MSRTTRRKNGYKGWGFGTRWTEHGEERDNFGWIRIPLSPKELHMEIVRYEMDIPKRNGPGKWFRGQEHNSMRMLVKGELARFWKDPDHEIQVERRRKHDYWD